MSTNFPTALDTLTNPNPTDYLNSPSHAGQHANANDAIEALEAFLGINGVELMKKIYPVGSVYINYSDSTNPGTLLGFGTWVATAVGRAIVGIDAGQTEFDTAGETGGAKTHTLTASESGLPAHPHQLSIPDGTQILAYKAGASSAPWGPDTGGVDNGMGITPTAANNTAKDASSAHNNLQPYQVFYIWRRTA